MGKSAPEPPNPADTIAAQSAANTTSANQNATLNRIDQYTPYGSSTYDVNGYDQNGTPKYSQTISLAPAQQNLLDLSNQGAQTLGHTAVGMLGQVQNSYANPIDTSSAPGLSSGVQGGPLASGINSAGSQQQLGSQNLPNLFNFVNSRGQIASDARNQGPGLQGQLNTQGVPGLSSSVSNQGPGLQGQADTSGVPGLRGGFSNQGPGLQGQIDTSNAPGIASGVNNQGPNMRGNINYGGQIQNNIGYSGPGVAGGINYNGPGITDSINSNGPNITGQIAGQGDTNAAIQSARDAAYRSQSQYLDPQYDQGQKALENSLANQGITQGSEAYNNAVGNFGRQKQAAYQSAQDAAVAQGNALQSQLFNQGLSGAQLQNSANSQAYGQAANNAQFQNSANAQGFNQATTAGQFQNSAQAQAYGQSANDAAFQNSAQAQGYGQAANNAQFQNSANAQGYNQGLSSAQLQNQANSQYNTNALNAGQFQNQANQQGYSQAQGAAQFQNAANQQGINSAINLGQFQNQANAQGFSQGLNQSQLQNQANAQGTANALNAGQFQNSANAQGFNQGQQAAQLQNAAQAQSFGQGLTNTNLYNQNQNQRLQNSLALNSANNAAQSTQFGQNLQAGQFQNQAQNQQYAQGLSNANLQNQAQAQYLQQLFALRNQPLNEYNALSTGAQVTQPSFNSVPQTNVATTDAAGITNQAYQNQLAAFNASNAGINNLFSLGGTLGAAGITRSDRRLKRDIVRVGTTASGIPTYTFRYNNDDDQTYFGVMADEVRHIPGAVVTMMDGYDAVDYSRLK